MRERQDRCRSTDKSILDAADDAADGRRQGAGRHRQAPGSVARRRSHQRQHLVTFRFKNADVKMLAAEERLRGRRPQVPRRRDHHRRTPTARQLEPMLKELGLSAWAVASAPGGEDARPRRAAHRLRPQLDAHAGRRLGARGARHLRRAVHLLRRSEAARGQPAVEVRRASSSRTSAAARCRR